MQYKHKLYTINISSMIHVTPLLSCIACTQCIRCGLFLQMSHAQMYCGRRSSEKPRNALC